MATPTPKDNHPSEPPSSDRPDEQPEVFSLRRDDNGWSIDRRSFLSAPLAAAATSVEGQAEAQTPLFAHDGAVTALVVNNTGRILLSGSRDGSVKMWSTPMGAFLELVLVHEKPVRALAVNPKGTRVASASDDESIRISTLPEGDYRSEFPSHPAETPVIAICPTNRRVATADADKTIRLWSVHRELEAELAGHRKSIHALSFLLDGSLLASAGFDPAIFLWSVKDHALLRTVVLPDGEQVTALALEPEGEQIVVGNAEGRLRLVSLSNGKVLAQTSGHDGPVTALTTDPQRMFVVSGGADRTIKIWRLKDLTLVATLLDLASTPPDSKGLNFKLEIEPGRWVAYTLPCGQKMPAGAVCLCNCVPGNWTRHNEIRTKTEIRERVQDMDQQRRVLERLKERREAQDLEDSERREVATRIRQEKAARAQELRQQTLQRRQAAEAARRTAAERARQEALNPPTRLGGGRTTTRIYWYPN